MRQSLLFLSLMLVGCAPQSKTEEDYTFQTPNGDIVHLEVSFSEPSGFESDYLYKYSFSMGGRELLELYSINVRYHFIAKSEAGAFLLFSDIGGIFLIPENVKSMEEDTVLWSWTEERFQALIRSHRPDLSLTNQPLNGERLVNVVFTPIGEIGLYVKTSFGEVQGFYDFLSQKWNYHLVE